MGNRITHRQAELPDLKLSNGATTVLLHVLLLSGSEHAGAPWEQSLVTWLAERDQAVYGLGTVGFDLQELPWEREYFGEQHAFVLAMIDRARGRYRWDELGFDPPFVPANLEALRELVVHFSEVHIDPSAAASWSPPSTGYRLCSRHRVATHSLGCPMCNN